MLFEESRLPFVLARLLRQPHITAFIKALKPTPDGALLYRGLLLRSDVSCEIIHCADALTVGQANRWSLPVRSLPEIQQRPDGFEPRARLIFEIFGNRDA